MYLKDRLYLNESLALRSGWLEEECRTLSLLALRNACKIILFKRLFTEVVWL